MNDEQYFELDYLSVSRLGVVKCLRDSLELFKASEPALEFGKQFHQAALEPEKYSKELGCNPAYQKNKHKIAGMVKALKDNAVFCELSTTPGFVEHPHFFKETAYDLDCKIKMDKYFPDLATVLDLKSTACKTIEDFAESVVRYGYHRQAAFYLDGTGARKFIIIGVSKSYPHTTFTIVLSFSDPLVEQGRHECGELIEHYLLMPVKPDFKLLMN